MLIEFLILGEIRTGEPILSISGLNSVLGHLAVGTGEELLFRGFLQFRFVAWLGEKRGIFYPALIHSVGHLPMLLVAQESLGIPLEVIPLLLLIFLIYALSYGIIAYKTKSLLAPIILHTFLDVF